MIRNSDPAWVSDGVTAVTDTLQLAHAESGYAAARVVHKPRLLGAAANRLFPVGVAETTSARELTVVWVNGGTLPHLAAGA